MNYEDLLGELDVLALDSLAVEDFGPDASAILTDKRRLAVEWVRRSLEREGLSPGRHLTRHAPSSVYRFVQGGSYTDLTALLSGTSSYADLSTVLATPATDSILLAHTQPFCAFYAGMLDEVNAANTECVNSVTYWNGGKWASVSSFSDGTAVTASGAWSGGGRVSWQMPTDMQRRPVNNGDYLYWVRLRVSVSPSAGTNLIQLLPIRRSRLTLPAAFHALAMLYEDGDTRHRGDWQDKAERYYRKASELMADALPQIRDEFDADDNQSVEAGEVNSPSPLSDYGYTVQRG